MDTFLKTCKDHSVNLSRFNTIHLIVGNESCDLDSAVSSVVLAYILHMKLESSDSIVLPLLNASSHEIHLKTELAFWFEQTLQLNLSWLICKDEINFNQLKNENQCINITLVDHNKDLEFESIGHLIGILDHHKPEVNNHNISPERILIDEQVGSCATLVAERYFNVCGDSDLDVQVLFLLYGPIILDTLCFSESVHRFCEKDVKVVEKIESIFGTNSPTRQEVYDQLLSSKNAISALSLDQLLKKDMKIINNDLGRMALSSIPGILVQDLLENEERKNQLEKFREEHDYLGVILLGISNSNVNEVKRDLALYIVNHNIFKKICDKLQNDEVGLNLKLVSESPNFKLFHQLNTKLSRKFIMPLVSELLADLIKSKKAKDSNESPIHLNKINRHPLQTQISTADVDPEFVVNYQAETVKFPESPRPYSAEPPPLNKQLNPTKGKTILESPEVLVSSESNINHPIPNTPTHNQSNSICYYESYFEDSFVGEFSGEVDVGSMEDEIAPEWCNDPNIENLEFGFDSFGPESLIFTGSGSNDQACDTEAQVDLQAPTIEEVSLNEKLKSCFDESRIKNNYDLNTDDDTSPRPESANTLTPTSSFQRNSSLTQSIKKKISPKLKFEDLINSSDDSQSLHALENKHSVSENEKCPSIKNNSSGDETMFQTPDKTNIMAENNVSGLQSPEGTLSKQGTLSKKKISVNRDLLNSDDLDNTAYTKDDLPPVTQPVEKIPELTLREELDESRRWKESCPIEGHIRQIDMKVIEPYKKVISHGGYYHHYNTALLSNADKNQDVPAVILFSACYLPDRSRKDYGYVMDHLFMYVLTTLHELVADDYILIYFHNPKNGGGVQNNNMPTFSWLRKCYYMIDRKLRKNLKSLYLVHPTFWLKTFVIMTKPFISSKFARKVKFVYNLTELDQLVIVDKNLIAPQIKKCDEELTTC